MLIGSIVYLGLREEDSSWYLALQGMQEDYRWWSLDRLNNCCCYRSQVRGYGYLACE